MQVQVSMRHARQVCPLIGRLKRPIRHSDRTNVLHGANPELWHVNHIILGERKLVAEEITVKGDAFLDDPEYFRRVTVRELALTGEDSHRGLGRARRIFDHIVVASAQTVDVGADRGAGLEIPQITATILVDHRVQQLIEVTLEQDLTALGRTHLNSCRLRIFAISDNIPVSTGYDHRKLQRRAHTRLVKAGKETIAEKGLQVRIDVHFFVLRVPVKVQPGAIVHVGVLELELDRVLVWAQ